MINTKLAVLRSKPTEISAGPNVQLQFQDDAAYLQHQFSTPSRATTPSDPDQDKIKQDDRSSLPSLTHSPLSAFESVINTKYQNADLDLEIQPADPSPKPSSTHTPESGEVKNQLNNQLVPSPGKKPLGLGNPDSLNNSFMEVKEKIPKTNSTPYVLLGLTSVGSAAASAGFFLGGFIAPAWFAVMITSVSFIAGASIGIAKYKGYKERARAIRDSNPAGNNRGKGKNSKSPKKDVEMGNLENSDLGISDDASVSSGKSREHRHIKNGEDVNAEPNPGFEEASTLVSQAPQAKFVQIQDAQTSPINFDSILPASAPELNKLSGKESQNNIALAASKTGKGL